MGITTDIIVGFPGETEADFEETLSVCRSIEFDNAFVFKYSPRRDTPAASMTGALPEPLIEERHRRLLDVINEVGKRRYDAMVGRVVPILVEGISRRNATRYEGRTRCNKIVVFSGATRHVGQVIPVRIERVGTFTLYGDPSVIGIDEAVGSAGISREVGGEAGFGRVGMEAVGELNR